MVNGDIACTNIVRIPNYLNKICTKNLNNMLLLFEKLLAAEEIFKQVEYEHIP